MFVSLLIFVYYIDPLQYVRKSSYNPIYMNQARYQHPALARTQDYDAVVLGTSHAQNFRPSVIKDVLGFQSLPLAISGSTPYEQILVLNIALNRGIVKNVIWGLEIDNLFSMKADAVRNDLAPFPYYLYNNPLLALPKYLINLEIIFMSLEVLSRKFFGLTNKIYVLDSENMNLDLDSYNNWHSVLKREVSEISMKQLKDLDDSISSELNSAPASQKIIEFKLKEMNVFMEDSKGSSINYKNNLKNITEIIESHPEINFFIFIPPHSITWLKQYQTKKYEESTRLNLLLAQHFLLLRDLLKYKNVQLYGFFDREDIIMNLDNFRDITHYWQHINDEIIMSFKKNKNKISSEEDIVKYIREVCRLVNKSNQHTPQ